MNFDISVVFRSIMSIIIGLGVISCILLFLIKRKLNSLGKLLYSALGGMGSMISVIVSGYVIFNQNFSNNLLMLSEICLYIGLVTYISLTWSINKEQ